MEIQQMKIGSMETKKMRVERGSYNIFADLGHPEPEVHLLKAELVTHIDKIIRHRKLKRIEASKLLRLSQPEVSRLLRGNFHDYSLYQILRFLTLLGRDVEIIIRESCLRRQGRLRVAVP